MKRILTPALAAAALSVSVFRQEGIQFKGLPAQHGQIALANDTLFSESSPNVELSDYAVGYRDAVDLEPEIYHLFPQVQVPDRFTFRTWDNAEAFLADDGDTDVRGLGTDFGEVEQYHNIESETRTLNKGLCIRLDKDRLKNMPNWQEFYTGQLKQRLLRCDLRRGISLMTAAAVNTNVTWDSTAGKDPDMDINTLLTTATDLSGVRPNSIYVGETAWNKRWGSFRAQNNAGGYASAGLDINGVGASLGLPRRFQSQSRYQSAANAKSQFAGNKVFLHFALDSSSEMDPSNAKYFWSPCDNGQAWQVWVAEKAKFYWLSVEHYSRPTITSTLGIRQLTVS